MMNQDQTYIACLDAFWESGEGKPGSAFPAAVYLYILHRLRRNGWEPLLLSDEEVCKAVCLGKVALDERRKALWGRGLLLYEKRTGGAVLYRLPESLIVKAPAVENSGNSLARYFRSRGDEGVAVSNGVPQTLSNSLPAAMAVDGFMAFKSRAAEQGEEILKAVLSPYSRATMEVQLMQNRVDFETYLGLVKETVADWVEQGTTHDGPMGCLDIQSAVRHLRNTVRIKARALKVQPRSRDERRADLMTAAVDRLHQAESGVYARNIEMIEKPF